MPIIKRQFTVILEEEESEGYAVHCPALPGCASQGEDKGSALENIKEAIHLVWETLADMAPERVVEMLDNGKAPPYEDTPELIAQEILEILRNRYEDGLPLAGVLTHAVEVELPVRVSV